MFPDTLAPDVEMVTVPACAQCHGENQRDDAFIRNILISTKDTEQHPAVIGGLAAKRNRSLDRSLARGGRDIQAMLQTMMLVDIKTPAGIYIGQDQAFNFDNPVMNRFVERLSRALLWHEFRQPHFNGSFSWKMNIEMPPLVYEGIRQFGRARSVGTVFAYGVTPFKDSGPSWAITNFYGSMEFLIRSTKAEQGG